MSELFCSKVISEIVPSARAIVANKLLEKRMTQNEISRRLGITQPAISQYKRGLRGFITEKMVENKKFAEYLDDLAGRVYGEKLDLNLKTCEICSLSRKYKVIKEKELRDFLCLLQIASPN